MNIAEDYNSDKLPRRTFGLKAESTLHRITFNPSVAKPGEILRVNIPQLSEGVVIIPGSVSLLFDLDIAGHANNTFVNNIGRNLVKELKVSYGGETLQVFQRYDLVKTFEDLFIPSGIRETGLLKYGISNGNIRKLRAGAGDKPSSPDPKEVILSTLHGKKYRIFLDHPILNDHGLFYPRGLKNSILFQLTLASVGDVVVYSDTTKAPNFELTNIELEYSCVYSDSLARKAKEGYQIGKSFLYENISLEKTFTISKPNDGIINQQINLPRRSMSGLFLIFRDDTPGEIDSEKFVFPNIKDVKVTINGMPNRLYSKGMIPSDFWESLKKRFGGEVTQKAFYTSNKFALWIDMRTFPSNEIHGSGLKLDNTLGGVQLSITRKVGGAGNYTCFIFVVADAVMDVMNSDLHSISY